MKSAFRVAIVLLLGAQFLAPFTAFAQGIGVQVSGFSNFDFGTWSSGSVTRDNGLCVYNSSPPGKYLVTAQGSGGGGAFAVANGAMTITYQVQFRDDKSAKFQTLSSGRSQGFKGANTTSTICNGSSNATLRVSFDTVDLDPAEAGSYSGTLRITVDPN